MKCDICLKDGGYIGTPSGLDFRQFRLVRELYLVGTVGSLGLMVASGRTSRIGSGW